MKIVNVCPRCGGELQLNNGSYKCSFCGAILEEEKVDTIKEQLKSLLDELKQEKLANLRARLWEATHDKYQSKEKIISISREIRNYLPDDLMACFYETINTKSSEEINDYLRQIDVKENYYIMDLLIDYLIGVMDVNNILAINNLIENTFKNKDLTLYNKYCTKLEEEASKLEEGIYELGLTRDVFVAYSSKDMKYVEQVVGALEENGISCFVAMRNLRHGKGAVENYDLALEQAMNNSKIFLLVSSCNSRSLACDALKKELPYLKNKDLEYAPAELRHDYNKLPAKYKKPRVQLLIDGKPKGTLADKMVSEIFNGFEWRYDVDSTVEAIFHILTSGIKQENEIDRVKKELEEKQLKQQEELKKMMKDLLEKQTAKTNTEVKIQGALGVEEKQLKQEENKKFKKNLAHEQSVNIGQNNVVTNSDTASSNYLDFEINNGVLVKYKGSDRTVIIPNNVIAIGDGAFSHCTSLTSITISDSVTSIDDAAFYDCTSLTSITIPDSVTSIGENAFSNCTSLTSITIPDSVTSIGNSAFRYCSSLTSITIPDSVTSIRDYAFYQCSSLTSITIPDSVTSIGNSAFCYCSSLTSITILDGVTSIGNFAFENCSSLSNTFYSGNKAQWMNINIGANNESLINSNIEYNSEVTELDYIETSDFTYTLINTNEIHDLQCINKDITACDFSEFEGYTIKSIGRCAFSGCSSLASIIIPDSVTSIGDSAFRSCSSLTSITIPDSVTSIGAAAFNGCSFTSFRIPKNVEFISCFAFSTCFDLRDIIIPKSVKAIGMRAFYGCYGLKVHYEGSEEDWNNIKIDGYLLGGNKPLRKARKEFNYKG